VPRVLGPVLACLVLGLTACTASHSPAGPSEIVSTHTNTITLSPSNTGAIDVGPTTAANASSCPLLTMQTASESTGMRLDRIQVLRQARRVIGCRFYALQGSPLATSEHLPGPNQPVIAITSSRFATDTAAHNALARLASAGTEPAQYTIGGSTVAVAFRTTFDPTDGAKDWAVAFAKHTTLVVIKTAISDTSADAVDVARAVFPKF
jgi:hypothetical protein